MSSSVPFVKGFRRPSTKQVRRALGLSSSEYGDAEKAFLDGEDFFTPVPSPSSEDDWLAQYNEKGQTFEQFLTQCPWLSSRWRRMMPKPLVITGKTLPEKFPGGKIYLLPLGSFAKETSCSFDSLADYTRRFFGNIPVHTLRPVDLVVKDRCVRWEEPVEQQTEEEPEDSSAPPPAKRWRTERKSYRVSSRFQPVASAGGRSGDGDVRFQVQVDSVLDRLHRCIPDDAICLVALTMADLYETEADLFVAGMARVEHRVAVFSFFRYNPAIKFSSEYWYDISDGFLLTDSERQCLMLQRSCRLLVHETAHLLAVDHCIWYSCCMNGSGHLDEDFAQPMQLCPVDLRKLHYLCGFDIVKRYEELLDFFLSHNMVNESDWLCRRLDFIRSSA